MKRHLFIIDPQRDFCKPNGALYVQGADDDMKRLAEYVRRNGDGIDDITVTMDSHRTIQIFHPIYWVDAAGNSPTPFTIITVADVIGKNPKFKATNPAWRQRSIDYVQALADKGRNPLVIWPYHCLISSPGHSIHDELGEALSEWERKYFAMVDYVPKGSNVFTEMYSIFAADVPDPADPIGTGMNTGLVNKLNIADEIIWAGEALSHCMLWSGTDLVQEMGDEHVKKILMFEDATSPVVSPDPAATQFFADNAAQFIKDMKAKGMRFAKTTDF